MHSMVRKALKLRFYPTEEQKQILAQTFGCSRFVYNNILKQRLDLYYKNKKSVNYFDACEMLTELKKNPEYSWLKDVSSVVLQQSLRHQQSAFKNFFDKRAKYPKFKKKQSRQSIRYAGQSFKWKNQKLSLAKMEEPLNIKWSYSKPKNIKSLTVSKDSADRYFVAVQVEFEPQRLQVVPKTIGIDLGIKDLIVTSDGFKSGSLKLTKKYEKRLALAQRNLFKKQKGSKNRNKARLKVARIHAKITDARLDNIHKLSRKLVNENQVIVFEDLNIAGMKRNRKLSKAISDMSWGELVRQCEYKADWAGRQVVKINRWFPSTKRCSNCGHVVDKVPLSVRNWTCPECETEHDRDINAAINIKAAGLAVLACGATGSGNLASA